MIETSLKERFHHVAPFLSTDFLHLEWTEAPFQEAVLTKTQQVAALRPDDYLERIFNRLFSVGAGSGASSVTYRSRASSLTSAPFDHFAFISYAHRDRNFVDELMACLNRHRIPLWFDNSIAPSATWDETLESRIHSCAVLIACVSDEYQASKYCRREIKFADLLKKPILPVARQPWVWGDGLQVMFQEYQILSVGRQVDGPAWSRACRNWHVPHERTTLWRLTFFTRKWHFDLAN